jgi:hypothetical protein
VVVLAACTGEAARRADAPHATASPDAAVSPDAAAPAQTSTDAAASGGRTRPAENSVSPDAALVDVCAAYRHLVDIEHAHYELMMSPWPAEVARANRVQIEPTRRLRAEMEAVDHLVPEPVLAGVRRAPDDLAWLATTLDEVTTFLNDEPPEVVDEFSERGDFLDTWKAEDLNPWYLDTCPLPTDEDGNRGP